MSHSLKEELHLHLYGCLTPKDLFQLGKDRYRSRAQALAWYGAEYETHVGRLPDWQEYWQSCHGEELIAKDFLATTHMRFPQFQARFNLMIALLPTTEQAVTVLNQIVPEQVNQGISYSEFRIFVPPLLQSEDLKKYYEDLAYGSAKSNSNYINTHTSRVVLSVSRNPQIFMRQYQVLRDLQQISKNVAEQITALDFCGVEEGFPPEQLKDVFELIHNDNNSAPEQALAILYHVGESFDEMSVFAAMRWIHLAAQMGGHRLGHATAAGIRIKNSGRFKDGTKFFEPIKEAHVLLDFLTKTVNEPEMVEICGFLAKTYEEALLRNFGKDRLELTWNSELRHAANALQTWTLSRLSQNGNIVETCPTSNRIIGRIEKEADLPVFQFSENKVPLIISSDDPGIFATTLKNEETICRRDNRISAERMEAISKNYQAYRAGILAGRPTW
jgi:adenosine deaminase